MSEHIVPTKSKRMKKLKKTHALLINIVTVMILASLIFFIDGDYPLDYINWVTTMTICILVVPWCFIDYSGW